MFFKEKFQKLISFRTHPPDEAFDASAFNNCVRRLHAHFADLGDSPEVLSAVKLIVLGNRRIGKTQICNRLLDRPPGVNADSTYGIQLA